MTQSAVASKLIIDNGREKRSDGLLKHLGLADVGSLRVVDNLTGNITNAGGGVETIFVKSNQQGYLQAFDRSAQAYLDLNLYGKNIALNPQAGGKVILPAGTAQQALGNYRSNSTWSVPAANQWLESPVQVTATTTGGLIRCDVSGCVGLTVVGQILYYGLGIDGTVTLDTQTLSNCTLAGALYGFAFTAYVQPAAGAHRFALFLYVSDATGGPGLRANSFHNLWVTEQRA